MKGTHARRRDYRRPAGSRNGQASRLQRKSVRVGLVVVVAVLGAAELGAVAHAYWSSSGTGSGTATADSATISITSTTGGITGLYPGDVIADVTVSVKNTSLAASIVLQTATAGTTTVNSGHAGCVASAVTFTPTTIPATSVAPNGSASVLGNVTMDSNAANACQGATFTIPVTVTGRAG